jgi:hypothetical protein
MKDRSLGLKAPLIFKTPKIEESSDGDLIFVTRKCSFDMSFYQVKKNSLHVEFHQEEGNDHAGLVR